MRRARDGRGARLLAPVLITAVLAVLAVLLAPGGAGAQRLGPAATRAGGTPEAALGSISQVAGGDGHSCFRLSTGNVKCSGNNFNGQLGDGTRNSRLEPVLVSNPNGTGPLGDVAEVATGGDISCARLANGQVRCWGINVDDQLGGGSPALSSAFPVVVSNTAGTGPLTNVTQITVGAGHACARLGNGQAVCWGFNASGQLGDGTTTSPPRPVAVSNPAGTGSLTNVSRVAAGNSHTCARLTTGQLRCWGANASGRLGDGTTTDRLRPVVVKNPAGTGPLTDVSKVATGHSHTCARLTSGQLRCWGANSDGRVGDGTTTNRLLPVVVSNPAGSGSLRDVSKVAAGAAHTCVRLTSGQARCWGSNANGRLGDGTTTDRPRPVVVSNPAGNGPLTDVKDVAAGVAHTCVKLGSKNARCWGQDSVGRLGDGAGGGSVRPAVVQDGADLGALGGITQIVGGGLHVCGRTTAGEARCWGFNDAGQTGNDDTSTSEATAVPVVGTTGSGRLSGIVQLAAGSRHTCARLTTGQVRCWGDNFFSGGALGDGSTTSSGRPVVVSNATGTGPLTGVAQIAAGAGTSCAVLVNGQARCWGFNSAGEVGDNTTTNRTRPVTVLNAAGTGPLTDVAEIAIASGAACARLTTGQVRCWGNNANGRLGDGTTTNRPLPVTVLSPAGSGALTDVAQISIAQGHACARLNINEVRCWGNGADGRLGDGTGTTRVLPTAVLNPQGNGPLTGVGQVVANGSGTCARVGAQVRCWGDSVNGETGDNVGADRVLPVTVLDPPGLGPLTSVTQVARTGASACALLSNGEVRCWGDNAFGSIGDGTTGTDRFLATATQV
ncbi:MAG: RCC1 repeat-containing protein [Acidimicrobiales bacterium]|nr:RCC1 repeat-containing protein [Acidimicrobiales bacterium]